MHTVCYRIAKQCSNNLNIRTTNIYLNNGQDWKPVSNKKRRGNPLKGFLPTFKPFKYCGLTEVLEHKPFMVTTPTTNFFSWDILHQYASSWDMKSQHYSKGQQISIRSLCNEIPNFPSPESIISQVRPLLHSRSTHSCISLSQIRPLAMEITTLHLHNIYQRLRSPPKKDLTLQDSSNNDPLIKPD